jgi:hypothetical protein
MDYCDKVNDVGVLKRLMFATSYLPADIPQYWEIITKFGGQNNINPDAVRVTMENIKFINPNAFTLEIDLLKQLISMPYGSAEQPLGMQLVPQDSECKLCKGTLVLCGDRPSRITLYTDTLGTAPANHYHKYCRKRGCTFVQYYGYSKSGSGIQYDDN